MKWKANGGAYTFYELLEDGSQRYLDGHFVDGKVRLKSEPQTPPYHVNMDNLIIIRRIYHIFNRDNVQAWSKISSMVTQAPAPLHGALNKMLVEYIGDDVYPDPERLEDRHLNSKKVSLIVLLEIIMYN